MNKVITALIIGVAIILAGFIIGGTVEYPIGATSGPDYYDRQNFFGGLVDGGVVTAISSTNTAITAKQVCDSSVINWTVTGAVTTVATTTFPGAAAMNTQCLMQNGASKTFLFRNVSIAASTTQFVVASTTSDTLLMPEATGADTVVEGQASSLVTFLRTAASTVVITVTELINGD